MKTHLAILAVAFIALTGCAPGAVVIQNAPTETACLGAGFTDSISPLGARIAAMSPGSPLDLARVRVNDVVTGFGGNMVTSPDDLGVYIKSYKPGDTVIVRHLRARLGIFDSTYESPVRLGTNRGQGCIAR